MAAWEVKVSARYEDSYTGAVTAVTYEHSQVEARHEAGAEVSGLGMARSLGPGMAGLLDDPDTKITIRATRTEQGAHR